MSEPTQYDLVQDARLDAHERLITPQDRERYGVEYSFPVVGQQVSDDEFQQMMLSTAAGILDQGGRPFWLKNFDDASRTAQLTVSTTTKDAKAAINGFFYRLVQDMTISLPMPSTPTTYHVCLTYDPLGHGRQSGPISVQVYAGSPPYRDGLLHVELWTVECKPSQLLSDAKVVQKRPKVSPSITIDYWENRPDPRTQLWGTRMILTHGEQRGETYIALGASEITGGPTNWTRAESEWVNTNYIPNYEYVGHGYRLARKKDGRTVRLRGRMSRTNGKDFTQSDAGYWAMQLPEGWRPAQEVRVPTVSRWGSPQFVNVVNISTGGEVRIFPGGTTGWVCLDGSSFDVE